MSGDTAMQFNRYFYSSVSRASVFAALLAALGACATSVPFDVPKGQVEVYWDCVRSQGGQCYPDKVAKKMKLPKSIPPLKNASELLLENPYAPSYKPPSAGRPTASPNGVVLAPAFPGLKKVAGFSDIPWYVEAGCALRDSGIKEAVCTKTPVFQTLRSAESLSAPQMDSAPLAAALKAVPKSSKAAIFLDELKKIYGDSIRGRRIAAEIAAAHGFNNELEGSGRSYMKAITDQSFAALKHPVSESIEGVTDEVARRISTAKEDEEINIDVPARSVNEYLNLITDNSRHILTWNDAVQSIRHQQGEALFKAIKSGKNEAEKRTEMLSYDIQARKLGFWATYLWSYFRNGQIVQVALLDGQLKDASKFLTSLDKKIPELDKLPEKYRAKLQKFLTREFSDDKKTLDDFLAKWFAPDALWKEFSEELEKRRDRIIRTVENNNPSQPLSGDQIAAIEKELDDLSSGLLTPVRTWFDANIGKACFIGSASTADLITKCLPKLSISLKVPPTVMTALQKTQQKYTKLHKKASDTLEWLRTKLTLGKIGTASFTTRHGVSLQAPPFDIRDSTNADVKAAIKRIDYVDVATELLRVMIEASFDAKSRLPGLSSSTGVSSELLRDPLPNVDDIFGTDGYEHLSKADFSAIDTEATRVEMTASVMTGVAIRGINVFSLDNEALERLVETLVASLSRKIAEKAYWCAYACNFRDAAADGAVPSRNLAKGETKRVNFNVEY